MRIDRGRGRRETVFHATSRRHSTLCAHVGQVSWQNGRNGARVLFAGVHYLGVVLGRFEEFVVVVETGSHPERLHLIAVAVSGDGDR